MQQGIDERSLRTVVDRFYAAVRADRQLAPVFEDAIEDWPAHLDKLAAFWSAAVLRTGGYHGNPAAAHLRHADRLGPALFARWLTLWGEACAETLPADAAQLLRDRAARIADSLQHLLAFHARQAA